MRRRLLALVWLMLGATGPSMAAVDCRTDARFDPTATQARLIVIGEGTHGTNEGPAFVAAALCAYAGAGMPVLLAWEHPRDRQDVLNTFMDSAGTPDDRKLLVDAVLRGSSGQDSRATLEMLDAARRLRRDGHRVAVSLVDGADSDVLAPLYGEYKYALYSQAQRQALMANVVETRYRQYPDHAVLFFTSHASREVGRLGEGYESATLLLSRRVPLHVIGFATDGGSAWRCQGATLPEAVCKEYDVRSDKGYGDADRIVDLGRVTASPPASSTPRPIYVPPPASN